MEMPATWVLGVHRAVVLQGRQESAVGMYSASASGSMLVRTNARQPPTKQLLSSASSHVDQTPSATHTWILSRAHLFLRGRTSRLGRS